RELNAPLLPTITWSPRNQREFVPERIAVLKLALLAAPMIPLPPFVNRAPPETSRRLLAEPPKSPRITSLLAKTVAPLLTVKRLLPPSAPTITWLALLQYEPAPVTTASLRSPVTSLPITPERL